MNKFLQNPTYIGISIAFVLMLLKFFIIDIDIPKFEIAFYSPFDELFYVRNAYNQFIYNDLFFDSKPSILFRPIITNLSSYIGFIFFGDTYSGLRSGSLFLGIISLFLFWRILLKTTNNNYLIIGLPIFLAINFNFSLASIVVEPTIARTAMMLLSLWILLKANQSKVITIKHSFTIGVTICLIFLLSYPTNFFVLPASLLAFTFIVYKKQSANLNLIHVIKSVIIFTFGYLLAFITILSIHQLIGSDIFETANRSENYSGRVSFQVSQLIKNLIGIANAIFFRFNSLIAILILTATSYLIINVKTKKTISVANTSITLFILFLIFQTFFINDYAQRKLVILLPLILLFIAAQIDLIQKTIITIKSLIIIPPFLFTIVIILLQYKIYPDQILNSPIIIISHLASVLWLISSILSFHFGKNKKYVILLGFIFLFIPELYLSNHYFIQNRTFHYKNTLKSLNEYNNKQFLGGMSIGYQLYNNIHCKISPYAYYNNPAGYQQRIAKLAENNNEESYSIGYCKDFDFYNELDFHPVKVLMKKEKTVREFDVVLYKYQKD